MSIFFEGDSDSDVEFKTDNQYAQNYSNWRKKEELNKLKTKYGDDISLDENSSSSSDDEEGVELTKEVEKDFFKTLAYLKNKDPRIYNEKIVFFKNKSEMGNTSEGKKKKRDVPMYLKDYERKIILDKGGMFSDEEDNIENDSNSITYAREQKYIKESLKSIIDADDDDENEEADGLFTERKKSQEEKEKEDFDYKKWLVGEEKIISKEVENDLKPLKDYWNNPKLDEEEKFLRDYILNKKFLDKDNSDYVPTYDEIIHDSDQDLSNDEDTIDKQEEFEHKYNFRFEEPDQEFIKRYPRTLENSARKTDDRRKLKRQETKDRKKKEKEEKMAELKKLQELKRKEIEEKLDKLKEITGNSDIGFENEDIDGDFDPEAHDRRMQALFNNDYYQDCEEEQKPIFPEIDEELEIESWERYEAGNGDETPSGPHCEDDDFNMDCDYDPKASIQNELIESTRSKKKRKRKSKVAEALNKPKPKYDPNDKNYEKYFDEYYKLDCEDIIGDIPCRFKYRSVVPNDFGLTVEEILMAKERELNKWCSLKKAVQIRPENVEKYDQIAYKKKAENINLKRKILPSLFAPDSEEDKEDIKKEDNLSNGTAKIEEEKETTEQNNQIITSDIKENKVVTKRKKKKKNNKSKEQNDDNSTNTDKVPEKVIKKKINKTQQNQSNESLSQQRKRKNSSGTCEELPSKKMKKHRKQYKKELAISDARLSAYGINPKKFKNKIKFGKKSTT